MISKEPQNPNQIEAEKLDALTRRVKRLRGLAAKYKRAEIIQNALLGISNIATNAPSLDDFYHGVHRHLKQLIPADNFFIAQQDPNSGLISLPFFADEKDPHPTELYPDEEISAILKRGITGYVLKKGKPLLCDEDEFRQLIEQGEIHGLGSPCHQWLGVPIKNQDRVTGVLVVQSYHTEFSYGELELELMGFISHHISGVMERLLRHEQLETAINERTRELSQAYNNLKQEVTERVKAENLQKALFEIADLSASNTPNELFYSGIHKIISNLLPAQNCFIALLDKKDNLYFPFYVSQRSKEYPAMRPKQDGLTEYVLSHQKSVLLSQKDIRELERTGKIYAKQPELNKTQEMHQWIGIPLKINKKIVGALTLYSLSEEHNYQIKDIELLTFVSLHIANAIERKQALESLQTSFELLEDKVASRTIDLALSNQTLKLEVERREKLEAKLVHDAQHDGLTGLPNRNFLIERLKQALKHLKHHGLDQFALLFIDLDRFKVINDSFGHVEGDRFLIETSQRLKSCIRENDTLARMGGDEFVILLDSIQSTQDAVEVSERILAAIAKPYTLAGQPFTSGASVGIAFSDNHLKDTSESLLIKADRAMYQAKSNGKGCYVIYDSNISYQSEQEDQLKQAFLLAIKQQEITLTFNAICQLSDNSPKALTPELTWLSDEFGEYSHEDLVKLAQQHNFELHLDEYLFTQLTGKPPQEFNDNNSLQIHLPICSHHVKHKQAQRNLKKLLVNCPFRLENITLLFDEKAYMKDVEHHLMTFDLLTQIGIKVGLNHFGTGYSSISMLSLQPISTLTLDPQLSKHLIHDNQLRLIKAYQATAKALDITLIATGVDTHQQLTQFIELDYVFGQGRVLEKSLNTQKKTLNIVHKPCA